MKRILIVCAWLSIGLSPVLAQNASSLSQAIRFIKLANTLREVDKSQESINLLNRAMPALKNRHPYYEAVTNELLGLSYKDLRDSTTALRYLERARTQYTALKYVASGWGVNEIIRDLSSKNVYAGIQIGPQGVNVAIFKTRYETDFYEKDIKTSFTIANSGLLADASKSFRGGQDALRIGLDSIRRYNVPNGRIFIVFSSELGQGPGPDNRQALYEQLVRVLPDASLQIDTSLTASREAQLYTIGALPRKVWPTTSALHLGSRSTTGGYFDQDASRRNFTHAPKAFHPISLPIGLATLVERIEGKASLNQEAFKREAQRVIKALADSLLTPRLMGRDAGLQQRRTVGLGGDIALALVTYLHPEKADVTAVPILESDIEQFKRLALSDLKALTQPDLKLIGSVEVRTQAARDLSVVQAQLPEKQLIAGALWLEAIMKAYQGGSSSPKRFVFIRNASLGWVTGKFLETINYEYESTIAKGEMYTR